MEKLEGSTRKFRWSLVVGASGSASQAFRADLLVPRLMTNAYNQCMRLEFNGERRFYVPFQTLLKSHSLRKKGCGLRNEADRSSTGTGERDLWLFSILVEPLISMWDKLTWSNSPLLVLLERRIPQLVEASAPMLLNRLGPSNLDGNHTCYAQIRSLARQ
jgi:hypothetical protein